MGLWPTRRAAGPCPSPRRVTCTFQQRGGTDPSDPSDRVDRTLSASIGRELASIRDASGRRSDANSRPIGREIDANSRPIDATDATDAAGHGENGGLAVVSAPKVSSTARIAAGHCPVCVVSMHMLRLGPKPKFESGARALTLSPGATLAMGSPAATAAAMQVAARSGEIE